MANAGPRPGAREAGRGAPAARLPMRRRFTAVYKLQMIQQAERAVREGKGALQALLAREGLYSSHLAQWRRQNREGMLKRARRGRPAIGRQALLKENARLKRKLAYLEARLRQAVLEAKPPQGRGAAAHAEWIMRQRLLYLADLAQPAAGAAHAR
jgi:transposase-like protein